MGPNRQRVLRPSPGHALEFDFEGNAYLSTQTAPYHREVPLPDAHRMLLAAFNGAGTPVEEAERVFLRMREEEVDEENLSFADDMVTALEQVGALVPVDDPGSYYPAFMAQWYREHRTIPARVTDWILREGRVGKGTRVLDVGTGVGGVANVLAEHSDHVTGLDASPGLLREAEAEAVRRGVKVRYLRLNANRLVMHEERYDLITISLALHWMDPARIALGFMHVLNPGGRLIIIDGALNVPKQHPLHLVFPPSPRINEAIVRLQHGALFRGLVIPHPKSWHLAVHRSFLYDERRRVDVGYARGFVTPELLRQNKVKAWQNPEPFWKAQERKLARLPKARLQATFRWVGASFMWKRG